MGIGGVIRFFSMRAIEGFVAILLITFMPNLPPDAKYSVNYDLTPVMPFEGSLTLNSKLQDAEVWHKGDFHGPEAFAVYNGELYTAIHGGNVVKLIGEDIVPVVKFGKTCKGFYQEHICGRPLGMQFDSNGFLYVADAYYGIFKVDVKTGKQEQLVSMDEEINGKKPRLPNSVAVASNGDVYWTDSSVEFYLYDGVFDMLADGSGRLIHYDAKNKKNTVLIDKIHFANGIRLAKDESFVIVTETARCRVQRYYLKGPKKGTYDMFLDGLPGLPDNIQTDGKDGFIIPLVVGRDDDHPPPLNILGPFPLIRKFFSRIMGLTELGFKIVDQIYPTEWAERGMHYIGHFQSIPHSWSSPRQTILHVSKEGKILDSIHSLDASIVGMSEAFIYKDMLYMGSPFNDYVGRIPLSKVGWEQLALKDSDYPSSHSAGTTRTYSSSTEEPKLKNTPITDAPKMATPQPTQAPRVITHPPPTQAPKPKEEVHVHKREAPAPPQKPTTPPPSTSQPTAKPPPPTPKPAPPAPPPAPKPAAPAPPPAPKPAAPAPPPAPKPATPAPPPAPKPAAPAPPPKPAAPAPPPKPAASASPPAPKPAAPAPPPKPAAPASPPTPKPAAPASPPPPKPAAPASPPAPKPAAPAPPPAPKPAAPAPPPKPAAPAPKPAAPAPSPTPKPAAPAPNPKAAASSPPKPATPAAKPPTPASPPPPPKPAAAAPPAPTQKPAVPAPSPAAKPAVPASPPKPATQAPAAPKPAAPTPSPQPTASAPAAKPVTQQPKVSTPTVKQESKLENNREL